MAEESLQEAHEAQAKKPKMDISVVESCDSLSGVQADGSKLDMPIIATCAHFLKRKKRFCKMTVAKGNKFCGEHIPPEATKTDEGTEASIEGSARIPCPLDPKHTVFKKNLRKHLKICNARPIEDEPAYIQKGINSGEAEGEQEDFANLKLSDLTKQELQTIIDKVRQVYEKYVEGNIKTSTAHHNCLGEELSKTEYGKETRKHLLQTAALLGILQEEAQLKESTSFIEFGTGKGQLAYYLAKLLKDLPQSKVILLDRMSLRHKKDNKIEDRSLVQRIRVDIADFKMDHLDLLKTTKRCVAFSKHLCGAATDLTLRCITQPKDDTTIPATDFVMIALCCHHRCDWRSFVGKEFFKAQDLTRRDFIIITKMVSWAICGTGMSRERRALEAQSKVSETDIKAANHGLTLAERENIGLMCKRILDIARLEYLKSHGYEAGLKFYVSNDVTLENVCLLAKRNIVS